MFALRPPTGTTKSSLLYLLLVCSIHLKLINCQEPADSSASGFTCIPECGAGYECVTGLCKRQQCSTDCSGEERQVVCGSNGVNYNNLCELEKAKCELALDISLESHGPCRTVPPPPAEHCRDHQREFLSKTWEQYTTECNIVAGFAKYYNGTLNFNDVVKCYRPQCTEKGQYLLKQCSLIFSGYCWCSTPDGGLVPNTFQRNMPEGFCNDQQSCEVEGIVYKDGKVFTPPSVCGLCECSKGNYTCFTSFGTNLSDDQLHLMKEELLQVFNFQHNHNDHAHVDIRHIRDNPAELTPSRREELLEWKFNHYNKNQDSVLNSVEEIVFRQELFKIFGCSQFFDQLSGLIDVNGDDIITMSEWKGFFDLVNASGTSTSAVASVAQSDQGLVKREAVRAPLGAKKPLHLRKKFRYVFY